MEYAQSKEGKSKANLSNKLLEIKEFDPKHINVPMPDGYTLYKDGDTFWLETPPHAFDLAIDAEKRGKKYIDLGEDKYKIEYEHDDQGSQHGNFLSLDFEMKSIMSKPNSPSMVSRYISFRSHSVDKSISSESLLEEEKIIPFRKSK